MFQGAKLVNSFTFKAIKTMLFLLIHRSLKLLPPSSEVKFRKSLNLRHGH
jgi:hypothetical protein